MNRYTVALLLVLLIALASVTLRKSFASVGVATAQNQLVAIGGSPPAPPVK